MKYVLVYIIMKTVEYMLYLQSGASILSTFRSVSILSFIR